MDVYWPIRNLVHILIFLFFIFCATQELVKHLASTLFLILLLKWHPISPSILIYFLIDTVGGGTNWPIIGRHNARLEVDGYPAVNFCRIYWINFWHLVIDLLGERDKLSNYLRSKTTSKSLGAVLVQVH